VIDDECGGGALLQQQTGWSVAEGELMEVMDGKCNAGAGKKDSSSSSSKMVGVLLEVS
jgi:hypothetical protein